MAFDINRYSTLSAAPPAPAAPAGLPPTFDILRYSDLQPAQGNVNPPGLMKDVSQGAASGVDQMQSSLYGLAGILGDVTNSPSIRAFAQKGAAEQDAEAAADLPSVNSIADINDTGDFFHWAAGSLGNAIPSLAVSGGAGGVGAAVGRRLISNQLRKAAFDKAKGSALRMGLAGTTEAEVGALNASLLKQLNDPVTQKALRRATQAGRVTGLWAGSALPQMGSIQNELSGRGISAPGSAVLGGAAAGALDALALERLVSKAFPGVEKSLADGFIKDVAKTMGTQYALEGSTEAAQEMIALAALAFNDPSFDIGAPENRQRVLDAAAAGALVGAVTGGAAGTYANAGPLVAKGKNKLADMLENGLLPEDAGGKIKSAMEAGLAAAGTTPEAMKAAAKDIFEKGLTGEGQPLSPENVEKARAAFETSLNEAKGKTPEELKASILKGLDSVLPDSDTVTKAKAFASKLGEAVTRKTRKTTADEIRGGLNVPLNDFVGNEMDSRMAAAINAPSMAANEALQQISGALGGVSQREIDGAYRQVADAMKTASTLIDPEYTRFAKAMSRRITAANAEMLGLEGEAKAKRQAEFHEQFVKQIDEFIAKTVKPIIDSHAAQVAKTLDTAPPTAEEVITKDLGEESGDELSYSDLATEDEAAAKDGADPSDLLGTAGMERMTYGGLVDKVDGRTGKKIKVRSSGDAAVAFTGKADAEIAARLLRTQNPGVPADSFVVTKRKDGYVVTAVDAVSGSQIRESKQLMDAVDKARLVALNKPDTSQATFTLELHRPGNLNKDGSKRYTRVNAQQLALGGVDIESNLTDNGTGTDTLSGFDSAIARLLASDYEVKGGERALNRVTLRHPQYGDMPVWKYRRAQSKYSTRTRPTPNKVGINARTPVFDRANPSYEGASELGVNPMRPNGSGLESVPSPEKISRKTISTPTDDFGGGVDSVVPVLEQGPAKLRPARRAAVGGAFERRPDTRNIANDEATENARSQEAPPLRTKFQRSTGAPVRVGLSVVDEATGQRVHDLVTAFTKLFGLKNRIIVVDPTTAATLVDHPLASQIQQAITEDPNARIIMGGEDVIIFLSERMLVDKQTGDEANASVRTFRAVTHELGHLVYQVYYDKLSPELKAKLHQAHQAASPNSDFEEWAADQLTAWASKKSAPRNAVESFFKRVTDKIRSIFNALRAKFPLDETFEQFLDGVVASREGRKLNDFAAHFVNEGVLGHAWVNPREAIERDLKPAGLRPENLNSPNLDNRLRRVVKRRIKQKLREYPKLAQSAEVVARTASRLHESLTASAQARIRRLPGGHAIADVFHRLRGQARDNPTYYNAVERALRGFSEQFQTVIKGLDEKQQQAVLAELVAADGKKGFDPNLYSKEAAAIRAVFDKMLDFGRENGLPLNKVANYFPRLWDYAAVQKNRDAIINILLKQGLTARDADLAWQHMGMQGQEISWDPRLFADPTNDPPTMSALKNRSKILDAADLQQYRSKDLTDVLQRYLGSIVARSVYNKNFGSQATIDKKTGEWVWEPQAALNDRLDYMRKQGATEEEVREARNLVDTLLGRDGRELPAELRSAMAWVMTYQNTRILLFSTLSSLPDIVGPAIRSQNFKLAYSTLRGNMAKLVDQSSDLNAMARSFGIISDAFNSHVLSDGFDNHWFPQGARKFNDAFFKGIQLQRWTNFTRVAAMATGIEYLKELAPKAANGDLKAIKHLAELGLKHGDVTAWLVDQRIHGTATYSAPTPNAQASDSKVADALLQFVNESIMRPNAAQRPGWMSDPRFMLISHLKSFLYTFHDTITSQLIQNFREADTPMQKAYIVAGPAMALLVLTAMGLELREMIQYKLFGRKAPSDALDGPDYLWTLIQRSGLLGPGMFVVDLENAGKHGNSAMVGMLGPSIEQLNMLIAKPATQSLPKSVPFLAQFPAFRDALRGDT